MWCWRLPLYYRRAPPLWHHPVALRHFLPVRKLLSTNRKNNPTRASFIRVWSYNFVTASRLKTSERTTRMTSRARKRENQVVAVLIVSPEGIPLVRDTAIRDTARGTQLYWKAPGGHCETGEMVEDAAVEEVGEEIGKEVARHLRAEALRLLDKKSPWKETVTYFLADVPTLGGIRAEKGLHVRMSSAD